MMTICHVESCVNPSAGRAKSGEVGGVDPARRREGDTFEFEQGALHRQAALVAAEGAVGADRPVAGNDDGKGVAGEGVADRAGRVRAADSFGEPVVGADIAAGDAGLGPQYRALELRAEVERGDSIVNPDRLAREDALDVGGQALDSRAVARDRVGVVGGEAFGGGPAGGEVDPQDRRNRPARLPGDGNRAECRLDQRRSGALVLRQRACLSWRTVGPGTGTGALVVSGGRALSWSTQVCESRPLSVMSQTACWTVTSAEV